MPIKNSICLKCISRFRCDFKKSEKRDCSYFKEQKKIIARFDLPLSWQEIANLQKNGIENKILEITVQDPKRNFLFRKIKLEITVKKEYCEHDLELDPEEEENNEGEKFFICKKCEDSFLM